MKDADCVHFLQWALPRLRMRWPGFRKVRRQVCRRVDRRLRELGLEDVFAYRDYLDGHSSEWQVLDSFCRISISRFYRDRRVFDLLRTLVLPQLAKQATLRDDRAIYAWSAGCASGEEPYTLRMAWELDLQRQFSDISLSITATDANQKLLERARVGRYPRSSLKDFPSDWISVAFRESEDEFCVRGRFRDGIEFLLQDVRQEQPAGHFDLIFCRHSVLTYYDEQLQKEVLGQILARFRPNGVLVIGKQEAIPSMIAHDFQLVEPHSGLYSWNPGTTSSSQE